MSDVVGLVAVVVMIAYPFGTVLDIPVGIPDPAEHPNFKSNSRIHGLFKTPNQPPAMQ